MRRADSIVFSSPVGGASRGGMISDRSRILAAAAIVFATACSSNDPGSSPPDRSVDDVATDGAPADGSDEDATVESDVEPDIEPDPVDDLSRVDVLPEPDAEPDSQADTLDAADAASDVGEDDATDDAEPDVTPEYAEVARLILVGDTGEGNETQYAVSAAIGAHCDARSGCDALLLLGDNIYDVGPDSPDDPQLTDYIDLPYAALRQGPPPESGEDTRPRLPLLCSLGNHDLGGAGLDARLAQHYIDYAARHDWFYFPTRTWEMRVGPVHLIALDTNPLAYLGTETAQQGALIDRVVAETEARWTLAFGHHPYRSNGPHGNAGSYEGIPGDLVFLGGRFREFVDDHMCDDVDFYISGHDHSRQWLRSVPDIPTWPLFPPPTTRPCFTRFGISGAGAKTSDLDDRDNDMAFETLVPGFLYMEFGEHEVLIEMCSQDGVCEHTETWR